MSYRFVSKILSILFTFTLLVVSSFLAFQKKLLITTFLLVFVAFISIWVLLNNIRQTLKSFYEVLICLEMDDFNQNFTFQRFLPATLRTRLQEIFSKMQRIRSEKEAQYLYLQSLVQHIPIGILSLQEGKVDFCNSAVLRILRTSPFQFLEQLPQEYQVFKDMLKNKQNNHQILRLLIKDEVLELIITSSEVQILGKFHQIISLQDFQAELQEKEMEAWQNLTRILTHEIINSVTPIASLASTLSDELKAFPQNEDISQAISVIEKRSQNLIQFVQEFRAFTKLPTPKPQNILVKEVFSRLQTLIQPEIDALQATFTIEIMPENLQLFTDLVMLEQILINLLKNALQAVTEQPIRQIYLLSQTDSLGKAVIRVQDTGMGISKEAQKSIFVPFFTTKKMGSGIGLSLSRQMMRIQGGSISVVSTQGKGSTFILRF